MRRDATCMVFEQQRSVVSFHFDRGELPTFTMSHLLTDDRSHIVVVYGSSRCRGKHPSDELVPVIA